MEKLMLTIKKLFIRFKLKYISKLRLSLVLWLLLSVYTTKSIKVGSRDFI